MPNIQLRYIILFLIFIANLTAQPIRPKLLILDKNMTSWPLQTTTALPWYHAGFEVFYRENQPYLVEKDADDFDAVLIIGGTMPAAPSPQITREELDFLHRFHEAGKGIVFAYSTQLTQFGMDDRKAVNQWLHERNLLVSISEIRAEDVDDNYRSWIGEYSQGFRAEKWIYTRGDSIAFGKLLPLKIERGAKVELIAETSGNAFIQKGKVKYPGPFQLGVFTGTEAPVLLLPKDILVDMGTSPQRNLKPMFNPSLQQKTDAFRVDVARRFIKLLDGEAPRLTPVIASSALPAVSTTLLPSRPMKKQAENDFLNNPYTIQFSADHFRGEQARTHYRTRLQGQLVSPKSKAFLRDGIRALWGRLTPLSSNDRVLMPAKDSQAMERIATFLEQAKCNVFWGVGAPQAFAQDATYSISEQQKVRSIWQGWDGFTDQLNTDWFVGFDFRDERHDANELVDFTGATQNVISPRSRNFWKHMMPRYMNSLLDFHAETQSPQGFVIDTDLYGALKSISYTKFHDFSDAALQYFCENQRGFLSDSLVNEIRLLPKDQRFNYLLNEGLLPLYYQNLEKEVEYLAMEIRRQVEQHIPDFQWVVYMNALPGTWFEYGLLRGLSRPDKPVLLFTNEPEMGTIGAQLQAQNIWALHATILAPVQFQKNEIATALQQISAAHDGFWISSAEGIISPNDVSLRSGTLSLEAFAALIGKN